MSNDIADQRKKIIPHARGNVLEIGMGSGLNLPFYDPGKVKQIWGVEPSDGLWAMTRKHTGGLAYKVARIGRYGEQVPLDDNSADTAVVTYSLCSIPDVEKALSEIRRILKPGGELLFCEHGRAPDASVRKWQERLNPLWIPVSGGCHLNRPISSLIEASGLKIRHLEAEYNSGIKIIGFNYTGIAIKY
jgi:ubiquinone/menaquinone biosynthesis C-methylase UbiE